tara:strand:+ start:198 stop:413 length:216 start_codon:yes stop_codon:yes gene_type:complete
MEKIDALISKFNGKLITHPELATMWINYLTFKKEKYFEIEKRAEYAIECMNDISDISLQTIMTIYTINDII